jgi:hypothetical protein
MKLKVFYLMIITICLLLGGCGQVLQREPVEIGGLVIRNDTLGPVYDVKLKVEKTRAVVTCNMILPEGNFATQFPLKRYQGNAVDVFWVQNGQPFMARNLHADVPEELDINRPAAAAVIIQGMGRVIVRLEQ